MINFENLKKVRDHLRDNVSNDQFDMNVFYRNKLEPSFTGKIPRHLDRDNCIACVIGHAGFVIEEIYNHIGWNAFRRCELTDEELVANYLFSFKWAYHDNTVEGAVARIDFVIKHGGVPENHGPMFI